MNENETIFSNTEPEVDEQPQIHVEDTITCKYCGRELNSSFDFCTFCGRSRNENPLPVKHTTKKQDTPSIIKAKKKNTFNILFLILALVSFGVAFLFFAIGLTSWASVGAMGGSETMFNNIFGSSDSSVYIISLTNVVASFFSSVIFILTGIVFLMFKNTKNK